MTSIYQKVAVATIGVVFSLATFEAIPSHSITFNEAVNGDLPRLNGTDLRGARTEPEHGKKVSQAGFE